MVSRMQVKRTFVGREVTLAFGVIVLLYLLKYVRVQPIQIPAYLLIVAYDIVELAVPILNPYHPVGFPVFLYVLAVVAAAVARRFKPHGDGMWTRAAGGVSLLVGTISILFGTFIGGPVIAASDNPTPFTITMTTGMVLLVSGWWLLGKPGLAKGRELT